MIHGQYLTSQKEAERFKVIKRNVDIVTGKSISPEEYAEYYGRKKKKDMR
jgi:hypothetical protein